jgi:DNA gyrase subunit A
MAIINVSFQKESQDRYLTYALSVVTGRALPDVRDGLKPVQRRILYAMLNNLNLKPTGSYKKSAAIVGEVLARYHPHGDIACYEAMVRMAQSFSLRYPLVDGQGNFGSLDGDSAAAYRYTEVKLRPIAMEVLGEIAEETVNFRPNFDASTEEPELLPSRAPQLLMNGASGIAVGMATNIPPHNLTELIEGLIAVQEEPDITTSKLLDIVKGPDFPTGCLILNSKKELVDTYETGQGNIKMRGEWKLEEQARGKQAIIITSIPYALNKSQLVEKIANLVIDKKLPQLTDVRDESTEDVRIVLEMATGADPELVMAFLFKNTPLESNFAVNLTALVKTENNNLKPERLSLKKCLQHFLDFRMEVVEKRLRFELKNLKERMHILDGLVKIFDALDEAIKIVRKSTGRSDAAEKLAKRFKLTDIQAFAVVDMRIYQLSQTNIDEIRAELKACKERVAEIEAILKNKKKIASLVKNDLEKINKEFGDKRLCKIIKTHVEVEINAADFTVQEDVYAIVSKDGWLKRIRQNNELSSTRLREGDSILQAHALNTLDHVAFFTNFGSLYTLKVSDFPSSSGYGNPIQKLLKFKDGENIVASFGVLDPSAKREMPCQSTIAENQELLLVTKKGLGFALKVEGLSQIKRNGKRVIKVRDDDSLAVVCSLNKNLAFFTRKGSGLVVKQSEVPVRAQAAVGVSLMGVRSDDYLVSAYGFDGKTNFIVKSDSGKDREVAANEITAGRRGLKGTKVIPKGEIVQVEKQ